MGKNECWAYLRNKGYSPKATAAIMGNIQAESAFSSNNVENRCPLSDEHYTALVDNGSLSREDFSRDAYGYGLYQHTYWTRKAGLYDLCKSRKVSISNEDAQHDWADEELHQPEYARVLKVLQSDASIADMTREFMCHFEKPGDQSEKAINYRVSLAEALYKEFADNPEETQEKPKDLAYWPPRRLEYGMSGPDVAILQAILKARGYPLNYISGNFDAVCQAAVNRFKSDQGLGVPGVVGKKTWKRLFDY